MQEICPREKCTGCAACYNVCPKNCIQMKENEYRLKKQIIEIELQIRKKELEKLN